MSNTFQTTDRRTASAEAEIACPYCGNPANLSSGESIYPGVGYLHLSRYWHCPPCQAWVPCFPGTDRPLGSLANAELRQARREAHRYVDAIWEARVMTRDKAYKWLAIQLGLTIDETHISRFDVEMCRRVVVACKERKAVSE